MSSCYCVGPQNGQPLCPCRMRNVQVVNGRYIETLDHGPISQTPEYDYSWIRASIDWGPVEKKRLVPGPFWDTDNPVEVSKL